jgi:hypothetical protein
MEEPKKDQFEWKTTYVCIVLCIRILGRKKIEVKLYYFKIDIMLPWNEYNYSQIVLFLHFSKIPFFLNLVLCVCVQRVPEP